jgi:hypothetical protein
MFYNIVCELSVSSTTNNDRDGYSMDNVISLLFPTINVIVTALFAGVVLSQYLRRHHQYQLYWAIALTMAFLATLAYVLMIILQPTSTVGVVLFRVYYILGAALMPAWLGLGSIALVSSRRVTSICLAVLALLSVLTAASILLTDIDMQRLSQIAGTPGTGILHPGLWLVLLIVLNTSGVAAVVGVAIYSGWRLLRRVSETTRVQATNLLRANVLILVGDLLNGIAGSQARFLGIENAFWLIMTIGWTVFFIGVLLAGRRSQTTRTPEPSKGTMEAEKHVASSS